MTKGTQAAPTTRESTVSAPVEHKVVIIGSGFAGLGAGIELQRAGEGDFVILEKADEVGGTWRDNTYPGCQCDVPSNLYSFSFALKPDWSRSFGWAEEIEDYLKDCARRFGIYPHVRFGAEVTEARWDDGERRWHVHTADGRHFVAEIVVSGHGPLSAPSIPDIPGIEEFEGPVFHSAQWDHSVDLAGKRVAVVGTGASAIQIVPNIQPEVGHLTLFQRTPPWIVPRPDRAVPEATKDRYRRWPILQRAVRQAIYWSRELMVVPMVHDTRGLGLVERLARKHLARQVKDPDLRRRLTPDYSIGCKRILLSNDYYPSLQQPNVDVVTDGIEKVGRNSVLDSAGVEHEVDVIVLATGFHVTDHPIARCIVGRDGTTLHDQWADGVAAYLGTTVTNFPNLFMSIGPNTGLGHTSMVVMMEAQFAYLKSALAHMRRTGTSVIEVTPQAQAAFNDEIQAKLASTVWNSGCASWYLDDKGRNTTVWPDFTFRYTSRLSKFDPEAYSIR